MFIRIIAVTIEFLSEKSRAKVRTVKYDLSLLKSLEDPSTIYDLLKKLDYPHSTLHRLLNQYSEAGIISIVKSEPYRTGRMKKFYRLTERGEYFLVEDMERILSEKEGAFYRIKR
jgi:DNA-binding PadR family transcriptional regulator